MKAKELGLLGLILLVSLFLRLWRLNFPIQPYFDEIYHLPAVQMMAEGDFATPFEWWHQADWPIYFDWLHPPLAKYFQASLILAFPGLSPVLALRLNSLIFSLLTLILFYFLVKKMAKRSLKRNYLSITLASKIALFATTLLSLDGLFLTMSRLGMNDMVYLFFSLLAVFVYYTYLQKKNLEQLLLLGLILGLALGTKWTALWLIGGVFIWELRAVLLKRSWLELPFLIFSLLLVPATIYLLLFTPYFLAGKSLTDWWQLQTQVWHFQWQLAESSPYQSEALSWLFQWQSLPFFRRTAGSWSNLIVAQVNPVFILFFIIALLSLLFFPQKRWRFFKALDQEFYLVLSVFLISFLPWQLISRPHFVYHFLPALPYLVMLLSWLFFGQALKSNSRSGRRAWMFNALFWPALVFVCCYPFWTALRVPTSVLTLYFPALK